MDHLAGILAQSFDAVICVDGQRQVVVWNSVAERLFATPGAKAIGRSLEELSSESQIGALLPDQRAAEKRVEPAEVAAQPSVRIRRVRSSGAG